MTKFEREQIEQIRGAYVAAMRQYGPDFFQGVDAILAGKTGLGAVDDLLPYVSPDKSNMGRCLDCAVFLASILNMADEAKTAKPGARGRRKKAAQAAEKIASAADLLDALGNDQLADVLRSLVEVVKAQAATCKVVPRGVVPRGDGAQHAMMSYCLDPGDLSDEMTGSRGSESRRTNQIRMVSQKLDISTPPGLIADVMRLVGWECSEADVVQARGLRKPHQPEEEEAPGAALARVWPRSL
jgi:hypothetical protein